MLNINKISDFISGSADTASILKNPASIPGDGKEFIIDAQYIISQAQRDLIFNTISQDIISIQTYTPMKDVQTMTAEIQKISA